MSDLPIRVRLRLLLEDDEELLRLLCEGGFIPVEDDALMSEHLEIARIARTLASELEVNWPGVDIVLRMRSELVATRRQVEELLRVLKERSQNQ
jgi:hypothetical protein